MLIMYGKFGFVARASAREVCSQKIARASFRHSGPPLPFIPASAPAM